MEKTSLSASLNALEKARETALQATIAEGLYRACSSLDQDGPVQRAIERARKLVAGKAKR
jgi:hypothetical protein